MEGPTFKTKRKRRQLGKTDYYARLKMIRSGKIRAVIRKSLRRIFVHFTIARLGGDRTKSYTTSRELNEYGWEFSKNNIPAAYLTGYLGGVKAKEKDINEVIPDLGYQDSTKGNKINATVKGLVDAGLTIPHSASIFPSEKRLKGKHISDFASMLNDENEEKYERQFKAYIRKEIDPKEIPKVFSQTLSKIAKDYNEKPPDL